MNTIIVLTMSESHCRFQIAPEWRTAARLRDIETGLKNVGMFRRPPKNLTIEPRNLREEHKNGELLVTLSYGVRPSTVRTSFHTGKLFVAPSLHCVQ